MSNLNFLHSGGNKVTLSAPDSNPSSNVTLKLPQADGSSGQAMVTNGSGALSFASMPTAGITMMDQYFLSVQKTANGNAAIALDTDFVRVSGTIPGAGHIGTGMTKNGEIFSFPSTGIYSIHFRACVMINSGSTGQRYAQNPIFITLNNGNTYNNVAMGLDGVENISGESFGNPIANFIFDVTDTSTHKCKFNIQSGESGWTAYVRNNRLDNVVTFTRLGDT